MSASFKYLKDHHKEGGEQPFSLVTESGTQSRGFKLQQNRLRLTSEEKRLYFKNREAMEQAVHASRGVSSTGGFLGVARNSLTCISAVTSTR